MVHPARDKKSGPVHGSTWTFLRFHHSHGDTHSTHQHVGNKQVDTSKRNQTVTRCTLQDFGNQTYTQLPVMVRPPAWYFSSRKTFKPQ